MTVSDLIEYLKKQPQELQVAYKVYSEQRLLEEGDIVLYVGCKQRSDGWIHDERPDKPKQTYLLFPGN